MFQLHGVQVKNGSTSDKIDLTATYVEVDRFGFTDLSMTVDATAAVGLGGLDTGVVAADTLYALHLVSGPLGEGDPSLPPGLLLSLSGLSPTFPSGYSLARRLGWTLTDSLKKFYRFTNPLGSNYFEYNEDTNVTPFKVKDIDPAPAVYTLLSLSAVIPSTVQRVMLHGFIERSTGGAGNRFLFIRATGSNEGDRAFLGAKSTDEVTNPGWQLCNSSQEVDYKGDTTDRHVIIRVLGYEDIR